MAELSTKPYLIRAIHEWCEDSGFRPYIAVAVDERTVVPREFVRNGEIVLNVSSAATNRLLIGNELIEFEARFSGAVREVSIPIDNVSAIYAQETGHGMAFDVPKPLALAPESDKPAAKPSAPTERQSTRPKLVPRNASGAAAVEPAGEEGEQTAAPVALAAVQSATEGEARGPRGSAPKGRRRGKLAAVPVASDAGESGSVETASHPGAKDAAETPPDEPSPSGGSGRPALKRVK